MAPCLNARAGLLFGDRHLILISLDGMAHYYFDDPKAQLPTLRKLADAN
jgi:predicted AlkP superfamily pyrophosphatase or phosphodiesterase